MLLFVLLYTRLKAHLNLISVARTLLATVALVHFTSQTPAAEGVKGRWKAPLARRLIIQPRAGVSLEEINQVQGQRRTLKRLNAGRMRLVEVDPAESVHDAAARFRASGLVEFAEPDYPLRASVIPNDTHFSSGMQWPLRNSNGSDIRAPAAWDILHSASNIVVAVVDTGIRYTHQDLAANMWRNPGEVPGNGLDDDGNGVVDDVHGINTVNDTGDPMDDGGHGTHVAGIIGAVGNNGIGIAGVAWNVKLMACKFLDWEGYGYTSDAVDSIDYAIDMGADVINASFGGEDYSAALFTAIQRARSAGIIFVTAAGNEQLNIDTYPMYPAAYSLDNIVVVGGSTRNDAFDTSYSNWGAGDVDLFAPGTAVYSTWGDSDNSYASSTGTSMASPHVAGAVALMKARFSDQSYNQIITRLLATVDVLPAFSGRCRTGGRLNLSRALGPDPWANFSPSVTSGEPPLTVSFSNQSLGDVQSQTWNFGDGSAVSAEAQPSHVFTRPGDYIVTLTVVGNNGQTDSTTRTIRVASNYQISSVPYAWINPSGMTRLTLTDNGVSAARSLPFSFQFYGVPQSSIFVGANGILGFATAGLANRDNVNMPSGATPNGIIAPFWDDLNPAALSASVHVGTVGAAPNRRFVVTWQNVPRVATGALTSFQAILEESGEITFQYRISDGGRSATIGVENPNGDTAALYSFNGSPAIIGNSTAIRLGMRTFRYLSVQQSQLTFNIEQGGNAAALNLDLENSGNSGLNWSASTSSPWLSVSSASGSLNGGQAAQLQVRTTPAALALAPGAYQATIDITNTSDGSGDTTVPVTINVTGGVPALAFTPASSNLFAGGFGGPFTPENLTVQVRNSGSGTLQWSASANTPWMQANPASGQLGAGESAAVQISLTSAASTLTAGVHQGSVEFRNDVVAGSPTFSQPIQVQINEILQQSSASIQDGQFSAQLPAPGPGDYAVEWSTDLETWSDLTTGSTAGGSVSFSDSVEASGNRFYRLRKL